MLMMMGHADGSGCLLGCNAVVRSEPPGFLLCAWPALRRVGGIVVDGAAAAAAGRLRLCQRGKRRRGGSSRKGKEQSIGNRGRSAGWGPSCAWRIRCRLFSTVVSSWACLLRAACISLLLLFPPGEILNAHGQHCNGRQPPNTTTPVECTLANALSALPVSRWAYLTGATCEKRTEEKEEVMTTTIMAVINGLLSERAARAYHRRPSSLHFLFPAP